MKRLIFFFAFVPVMLFSQNTENCIPKNLYQISPASGMKIRTGPGQDNDVIVFASSKEYILVCDALSSPDTLEGIVGNWRRVRYKSIYGYLFDGYISKAKSNLVLNESSWTVSKIKSGQTGQDKTTPSPYVFAVESYNYCGDITQLDPGIYWYGVYYNEHLKMYQMSNIDLEVTRSKYTLGTGLEFDVKSKSKFVPHFMIGSESKLDTNVNVHVSPSFFETHPQSLYPGQRLNIYSSKPTDDNYEFTMFATGSVTDVGKCPVMKNYKMKLTGEINDNVIVQDLTVDIPYFGTCGMPSIYWFGDFNGDLYPDFILASQGKDQTIFVLFVSDNRTNGKLVRKAGEWSYKKCD